MFWKEQPNTPVKKKLRSNWNGGNFEITVNESDTKILEINAKENVVKARLPAQSIGAETIRDGAITADKTNIATTIELDKTADGVITLLPSSDYARSVVIVIQVTDTFADGTGTQTVFKVGDETTDDKFITAAELVGEVAGEKIFGAGIVSAGESLILTADKATGDGDGGIRITAIATR